ncbi:hypothetical protein SPBR_05645 [Sporothrix brasiliensis 5110]|uniref:Centromere protein Scm3 n=1 Tax=Sporothrix brasiliensis 5110 TaxID=1398154 RepID=A0A0C2FTF5_9PEZI|nr:uncharacterized protein SPBR_05645 [Sporothrix brasiliensis 5110]KIH94318.1 hypothetical protein SPBR_05645 [Sporothrix brasiliensis 5110]
MEPPAKRVKVGRPPRDAPTETKVNSDVNGNNRMRSKPKKADDNDDDDEIAMDPEDYAMKVDPEYRLDRSRAVADRKLKSAFELLFEKYSQDFGDTGDEINFYTDEIEVDNGHIASLPVEHPSTQGGGHDSDDDSSKNGHADRPPELSAAATAASSRLVASLLPSRFGPGGTVVMGGNGPAAQGSAPGEVDPTWAAPDLPDAAFGGPEGRFANVPHPPPPRAIYAAPQRTVFTKALPTSYGEGDDDDDLILDSAKPVLGSSSSATPRSARATEGQSTRKRQKRTSRKPSMSDEPQEPSGAAATVGQKNQEDASPKRSWKRGRRSLQQATSTERASVPGSTSPQPPLSDVQSSSPVPPGLGETEQPKRPSSPTLPTPPHEKGVSKDPPVVNSTESKPKETFKRNTLDPAFVFSDEEDFGLKKRKRRQPEPTVPSRLAAEPQETVQIVGNKPIQKFSAVDESENNAPLEAPDVENREKRRPGGSRKGGVVAAVSVGVDNTTEVAETAHLDAAHRRDAQSLSIIIMETGVQPSADFAAASTTAPIAAARAEDVDTAAEVAAPVEIDDEPESASEYTPESEPDPDPDPDPRPGFEDKVEVNAAASSPPPGAESGEPPRKRKRRRQTEDSPRMPSSQKSSKASSLKSSQKSASSAQPKTHPHRGRGRPRSREIPDSQSLDSSGIISLVSDGSADEAEVDATAEASPRPFVPQNGGRQPVSSLPASRGSSVQTTPTTNRKQPTPSSRRHVTTPSRHRSHTKKAGAAIRLTPTASRLLALSPLARRQHQAGTAGPGSAVSSPGGSPIRTPGGTLRRCGKDGFRCEREFCFRCT